MATAALDVRPIVRSQVTAVAAVLARAFWDDAETRHLLPDEGRRRRVLPRYLATDVRDSIGEDGAYAAWRDGTIVGAAAWLPPSGYPVPRRRQMAQIGSLLPVLPWAIGAARRGRAGQAANRQHHRAVPADHVWLRVIGVDPAHQASGAGSALVAQMLGQADRDAAGAFLFTTAEANVAWYRGFGFEVRDQYRPTPTWPSVWTMWRDPTSAAGL